MSRPAHARERLDAFGVDAVCMDILAGSTYLNIAKKNGVSVGILVKWVNDDADRHVRVMEARQQASIVWEEKAEDAIKRARDPFELSRAKELAHHYRWRASKIDSKRYGDRLQLDHKTLPPKPIDLSGLSDEFKAELRENCERQKVGIFDRQNVEADD